MSGELSLSAFLSKLWVFERLSIKFCPVTCKVPMGGLGIGQDAPLLLPSKSRHGVRRMSCLPHLICTWEAHYFDYSFIYSNRSSIDSIFWLFFDQSSMAFSEASYAVHQSRHIAFDDLLTAGIIATKVVRFILLLGYFARSWAYFLACDDNIEHYNALSYGLSHNFWCKRCPLVGNGLFSS